MIKLTFAIIILSLLTGCASLSNEHIHPKSGSALDAATTYIALSDGAAEINPILSPLSPLGAAVGSVVLKHGAKVILVANSPHSPSQGDIDVDPSTTLEHMRYVETVDAVIETSGVSVGAWNLLSPILGLHPAIGIASAIVAGWQYWEYRDEKFRREEEAFIKANNIGHSP